MDDEKDEPITDIRTLVVRLQERMKHVASREEVGNSYNRIFQEVSTIFERTNSVQREYVRDRIRESALETKAAIGDSEKHLKGEIQSLAASVAGLTVAISSMTQQPDKRGWHPAATYGVGGAGVGTGLLGLLLYLLGVFPGAS